MKRIFLLTNIILCALSLHAQDASDYRPFIEEGKEWVSAMSMATGLHLKRDYFDGDTIVASKACKRWRQEYFSFKHRDVKVFTVAAFEENGKVWFFHQGETVPRLAYDFKAEVGDTLVVSNADAEVYDFLMNNPQYGISYFNRYHQDTILIKDKGTTELDGNKLKYICFASSFFHYKGSEYYFEGLGSLIRPTYSHSVHYSSEGRGLLYCTVNSDTIYYNQSVIDRWQEIAAYSGYSLLSSVLIPSRGMNNNSAQMVNGQWLNGKWYDLTGRRLAAAPAKGVYIENGKVRVAR